MSEQGSKRGASLPRKIPRPVLATIAGRAALIRAGIDAEEIDMVIVATSTPDHQIPGSAPLVQHRWGPRRRARSM